MKKRRPRELMEVSMRPDSAGKTKRRMAILRRELPTRGEVSRR